LISSGQYALALRRRATRAELCPNLFSPSHHVVRGKKEEGMDAMIFVAAIIVAVFLLAAFTDLFRS
jgi:hypothetical protein